MQRIAALLVVLLLAGCGANGASTEVSPDLPQASATQRSATAQNTAVVSAPTVIAATVGIRARTHDFTLVIHEMRAVPPQNATATATGYQTIAFDFSIENIGTQPLRYDRAWAHVKTATYRQYNAVPVPEPRPQLTSGWQQPGEITRGWVAFQVASAETPTEFYYQPQRNNKPLDRVTLTLY